MRATSLIVLSSFLAVGCAASSKDSSTDDVDTVGADDTLPMEEEPGEQEEPDDTVDTDVEPPEEPPLVDMELVVNGSFEDWTNAEDSNNNPDEWTNCTMGDIGIAVEAVPDAWGEGSEEAYDGVRFMRGVLSEGVGQTVPTVAGETYLLSFAYAGSYGAQLDVHIDGAVVHTTVEGDLRLQQAFTRDRWALESVEFVATATSTTFCLEATSQRWSSYVDLVSLVGPTLP